MATQTTQDISNWPRVCFGLALSSYAAYQLFKLPPVLPVMLADFGYSPSLAGGFMSIYAVAGILLSLLIARLARRYGTRPLILTVLGMMLAGNLLGLAVPESGPALLAARGIEGIAFAVLAITGPTIANASVGARHLPYVIALTASWIPIGQLSATALAAAAQNAFGWQVLWWAGIALTVALGLWAMRAAPRRSLAAGDSPDQPSAGPFGGLSRREIVSLVLAAGLFMTWSCQYFAYMTWLPQFLVERHGLGVDAAMIAYSLPVAILIAANIATGALLRHGVPMGPMLAAALVTQAAVWWLLPYTHGPASGLASLVIYGVGAGVVPTCLFAMPSAILGQGRAAEGAFATLMTGRNLGVLVGPVLLAASFEVFGDWNVAAPIFGGITTIAFLIGATLALRLAGVSYGTRR